jgi:GT2 family glycosyltransferase
MMTLDVSVIICAYTEDRWNDLCAAVATMQRQRRPPREIIVIVDHNTRLFTRLQAAMPNVRVLQNAEPQGLSGGRNTGIAQAQGALLAFIDDDVIIVEPDWLEMLVACFAEPHVLGAGGFIAPLWPHKPPVWFPHEFSWVIGCTYLTRPLQPVAVRNLFGGCMCIRREVFAAIGGFRNGIGRAGKLPVGCEETELCIRARQHWPDRIFLWQPRAVIHHRVTPQRTSWRYYFSRCYAEGLSKAAISTYVGTKDGLASERSYVFRMLPAGIVRGVQDGILHHDLSGFLRASAIVAGLCTTTLGYLAGTLSQRFRTSHPASRSSGTVSHIDFLERMKWKQS